MAADFSGVFISLILLFSCTYYQKTTFPTQRVAISSEKLFLEVKLLSVPETAQCPRLRQRLSGQIRRPKQEFFSGERPMPSLIT
ncbi:MAG: hypothetical protein QME75_05950 [Deltaproteobacteria bacterium]|nr:hypothetical protein [Deltaproteobacteria bacterium]